MSLSLSHPKKDSFIKDFKVSLELRKAKKALFIERLKVARDSFARDKKYHSTVCGYCSSFGHVEGFSSCPSYKGKR